MSSLIYKHNSRYNVTYVYESESYWDKEKKQPRSKRKLIGKLDEATGEVIPTGGRGQKPRADSIKAASSHKTGIPPVASSVVDTSNPDQEIDYRMLYEDCLSQMNEKDARLASQDEIIRTLTYQKNLLCTKLEELLRLVNP